MSTGEITLKLDRMDHLRNHLVPHAISGDAYDAAHEVAWGLFMLLLSEDGTYGVHAATTITRLALDTVNPDDEPGSRALAAILLDAATQAMADGALEVLHRPKPTS